MTLSGNKIGNAVDALGEIDGVTAVFHGDDDPD